MTSVLAKAEQYTKLTLTTVQGEIKELQDWEIDTPEEHELAGDMLKDLKRRFKDLEAQRTSITGPMNQSLKAVNNLFRAPKEVLSRAEKLLKLKLAEYGERAEQENQLLVDVAGAAETAAQATEALAAVRDTAPPQGVSVRHVWKAEIVDPDAVPRAFLVPNIRAIEAWGKGHAGEPGPLAGVKWIKQPIVSVRT